MEPRGKKEKQETTLMFPDVLDEYSEDPSQAFFELANASFIGYRLADDRMLKIKQDPEHACGNHTGGIVWETSFLLLDYLRRSDENLGRMIEVGAGCGLLGLALSERCNKVVLTEAPEVLSNLQANLDLNKESVKETTRAACLDWTDFETTAEEASIGRHEWDTILGTDVIFSPSLVQPLLDTLLFLSHETTTIYICVQVRCPTSHALFQKTADFTIEEIPLEGWAKTLECHLWKLTRRRAPVAAPPVEETPPS